MKSQSVGQDFFLVVRIVVSVTVASCAFLVGAGSCLYLSDLSAPAPDAPLRATETLWVAPDSTLIPAGPEGDLIRYGKELISHTARYLGPRGTVLRISNGINCQSCHLRSGTKAFGNNFSSVASMYPRFRARSGMLETIEKRVNDCLERSLNGKPLHPDSHEMRAFVAYLLWIGKDVPKGVEPPGKGTLELSFLDRPADPSLGEKVYEKHCITCHGKEGMGRKHRDSVEWHYPPLAGVNSYNTAAGMYRLSRLASFVKGNMPYGTTYDNPVLTDEEAWDVAAYINALPRPRREFSDDWPDITAKPFDHPFGPFADTFPALQHKYGPFPEIIAAKARPSASRADQPGGKIKTAR